MSSIHEEINRALAECHTRTKNKASRIYLGKQQMDRLMRWAKENERTWNESKRDGDHRPEVMGLPVYEVNDDDHCLAA